MDITAAGYLLFVIPGFCLVWTYRHFTNAREIGEFQYAAWSFIFGVSLYFLVALMDRWHFMNLPPLPSGSEAVFWGGLVGASIAYAVLFSFPAGFLGAFLSKTGLFRKIDKYLFIFLGKITESNKK